MNILGKIYQVSSNYNGKNYLNLNYECDTLQAWKIYYDSYVLIMHDLKNKRIQMLSFDNEEAFIKHRKKTGDNYILLFEHDPNPLL